MEVIKQIEKVVNQVEKIDLQKCLYRNSNPT